MEGTTLLVERHRLFSEPDAKLYDAQLLKKRGTELGDKTVNGTNLCFRIVQIIILPFVKKKEQFWATS